MTRRRGLALALVAALAGLALASGALVAKPRIPSTISLRTAQEGEDFVFRGRVRSEDPRCERRRLVEITANNFGPGSEPQLEGRTRTDERGRYELRVKAAENTLGGYRAKALRKERRRYICTVARSDVKPGPFRPAQSR